jgi:hypothetical protein
VSAVTARAPGGAPAGEFVPYVHGATLGCPSRGRPEKVLARLKTIGSIWREGYVPGEDGREGRVTANGALPRTLRNGMPEPGGYVYRGSDRSLSGRELAQALAGRAPVPPRPTPRPRRKPEPREFCRHCGQPKPDHLVTCRTVLDALPIAPPAEPELIRAAGPAAKPEERQRRKAALTTTCPGCGRPKPDDYATCGGAGPCAKTEAKPEPLEAAPALDAARRCRKCKYMVGTNSHKIICGDS